MIKNVGRALVRRFNKAGNDEKKLKSQKNKTHFRALRFTENLNGTQYFRDFGFKNVKEEIDNLIKDGYYKWENPFKEDGIGGFSLKLKGDIKGIKFNGNIIFYDSQPDSKEMEWYNRAHEETHALRHFNKLENLRNSINQDFRITLPNLDSIDSEVAAHIGGLYNTLIRGHDLNRISESMLNNETSFDNYLEALKHMTLC